MLDVAMGKPTAYNIHCLRGLAPRHIYAGLQPSRTVTACRGRMFGFTAHPEKLR